MQGPGAVGIRAILQLFARFEPSMDGPRPLRTNRSFAFGSENFFVRRDFAAAARELATAATDFRASVARFRARLETSSRRFAIVCAQPI